MIPKETIDKIIETARIEDVVGDFVALKRRGANLLGICPFHNERTPSFIVSPAKGIYKCFGCGKAGDSVSFVKEHEQATYPEALRYLAKKYNIDIVEKEQTAEDIAADNERESLFIVSAYAQKYFTEQIWEGEQGRTIGLSYFRERGFTDDTIKKFQLGYNPDEWGAFTDTAIKGGYKAEYLVKTGLTIEKEDGKRFDRFKGRVMFPIHNQTGRVIGFGGRILKKDDKAAKYVNSPESEIYNKSKVLYGLYFAKKTITQTDVCYLVEGYTDVISLHQAGVENVVASSGTSLTTEQIKLISRFTKNITILYDGDWAGIKASFRGIDMVLEAGMNVRVVLFPDGDDPDSYARKVSTTELLDYINKQAKDFVSFKTKLLMDDATGDPIKMAGLVRDIANTIAIVPDGIARQFYVKECARQTAIDEQVLLREVNKLRGEVVKKQREADEVKQDFVDFATEPNEGDFAPNAQGNLELDFTNPEYQERDIIRLLLRFAERELYFTIPAEDGRHTETVTYLTADYIMHELEQDQVLLDNPTYQAIYMAFGAMVAEGKVPHNAQFSGHEEEKIRQAATDMLFDKYALSERWRDKHNVDTATEDNSAMVLRKSVEKALHSLKMKIILKMIKALQDSLMEEADEIAQMEILEKQKQLLEVKRQLATILGRVILH